MPQGRGLKACLGPIVVRVCEFAAPSVFFNRPSPSSFSSFDGADSAPTQQGQAQMKEAPDRPRLALMQVLRLAVVPEHMGFEAAESSAARRREQRSDSPVDYRKHHGSGMAMPMVGIPHWSRLPFNDAHAASWRLDAKIIFNIWPGVAPMRSQHGSYHRSTNPVEAYWLIA
ncbi:hypothetical protein PG997_006990 [Apiospora hydei]|uniref:Uncharacterized protein n=1 Tax=Apiospora hydei TaxID=1337664 RepID=A0ABR1WQA3_9PEZI